MGLNPILIKKKGLSKELLRPSTYNSYQYSSFSKPRLLSLRGILIKPDRFKRRILRQQGQGCFQNAALLGGVVWLADGGSAIEFGKGSARRPRDARSTCVPTGQSRGDAFLLQCSGYQSHGLRTDRSGGHQQGGIPGFGFGRGNDGWRRLLDHASHIGLVTTEADNRGR